MFRLVKKLKRLKIMKTLTRIRCQIRIRQHAKRVAGQGWIELSKVPVVRLAGTIEPPIEGPRGVFRRRGTMGSERGGLGLLHSVLK